MAKMEIKVLGPGCANCKTMLERVEQAVSELGIEAQVEYVTGMDEIKKWVMMTPGLVIDGKVAHQGKPLPKVEQVKGLIKKSAGG
jgi:small redox-active disulfide protein 2